MRGPDIQQTAMFSYLTLERRIPAHHPLRAVRELTDRALGRISGELDKLYAATGRDSIPPERLLRALLLMVLYSIRSERQLMEQLDYSSVGSWAWRWTTRCGTRRYSPRTGSGSSRER
jgi:transposase